MSIIINHNSGFFSCCSVRLTKIAEFINSNKILPQIVDSSEQFALYKNDNNINKDITFHYFKNYNNVMYCNNIESACNKSDLIVIHTEWNEFKFLNFKRLVKKSNFKIYDMRNVYSPSEMKKKKIKHSLKESLKI